MPKLNARDVCEIRRLCWETSTSFSALAKRFGVGYGAARAAAKGNTWGFLKCAYAPYPGNPRTRERTLEDEVEMMEARVDCASYVEIALDCQTTEQQVRKALVRPSKPAHELFFRRNGYRFLDAPRLSLGKLSVDDVKKMLEMRRSDCTFERIGEVTGFSTSYVEQVIYGMRAEQKLALAEAYMVNTYGHDWKTWGEKECQQQRT